MTTFSYYTIACILRKFLQTFLSLVNTNFFFARSLLHILFLSLDHSCSRMFSLVYVYILLTYIEPLFIFSYILYFLHLSILPSGHILFYLPLLIFLLFPRMYYYYVFLFWSQNLASVHSGFFFNKVYPNTLTFRRNIEESATILKVPLLVFDILHFPKEAPNLPSSFLSVFWRFL